MKAIRNEVGNMEFVPFTIAVTIESQAEVSALILANAQLNTHDIDNTKYDFKDRVVWVEVLEKLAGELIEPIGE